MSLRAIAWQSPRLHIEREEIASYLAMTWLAVGGEVLSYQTRYLHHFVNIFLVVYTGNVKTK
ncbi:hypothetical protein SAMN05421821_10865 [Mucilaginibacter lappiensis]|uniref:Uncharacterized protein n=1 Tax=Mucilaginibacter lappiensis TaxID=354630 RepID=A0A1N7BM84_9SPHI|nr:hypothetical protein [Mucilaginibacter lappiensis]MBB6126835.1 hypothetical protein [Mucilaginibacter lappiensis]SIR52294.1 hypothetical protein SAMN05421821_10865 [Mucilaginibacter lappiensis]